MIIILVIICFYTFHDDTPTRIFSFRGIIFVIDSQTFQKEIKDVAE